jgi:hypothetical protein
MWQCYRNVSPGAALGTVCSLQYAMFMSAIKQPSYTMLQRAIIFGHHLQCRVYVVQSIASWLLPVTTELVAWPRSGVGTFAENMNT